MMFVKAPSSLVYTPATVSKRVDTYSVAAEVEAILSQYITNKRSGSEVVPRRGQYATSFPYQARRIIFSNRRASRL